MNIRMGISGFIIAGGMAGAAAATGAMAGTVTLFSYATARGIFVLPAVTACRAPLHNARGPLLPSPPPAAYNTHFSYLLGHTAHSPVPPRTHCAFT